jgi:ATP-dependent helicase/nuclease subunit A
MMMHEPLADADARAEALDPNRSFIVEAAAGSGKTSLLTQRLLVLLARVKAPEEVVAITFTRKAAAEMRGRVLAALALASAPDDLDPLRASLQRLARAVARADSEFGWQLQANPSRLRIQTIDALTASLVRRLPLLADLPTSAAVREDATELYRRAARRTLLEAEAPGSRWGSAVALLLGDLDNDWRRLEGLLVEMLARRDQWLAFVTALPSKTTLEEALRAALRAEANALLMQCPADLKDRLCEFARTAGRTLAVRVPDSPLIALAQFQGTGDELEGWPLLVDLLFTQAGKPRLKLDKRNGVPAEAADAARFKACYATLIETLAELPRFTTALRETSHWPQAIYGEQEFARLEALLTTLHLVAAQWRVVSAEVGECDFAEIALAALAVLGETDNPTELGLALDYQISHLLVDEFQDTSRVQYALLERLTAGWTAGDGRTLFMVGDPLQSIYRFRDADVSLFTRTVRTGAFGGIGLTHLRLSANFRTCANVIDWFNWAFPQVFADCPLDAPRFQAIAATQPSRPGSEVAVHLDDAEQQAARLVATVSAIRMRDPGATIAILVRGRAHLSGLLPALMDAGIPVAATDIEPLHHVAVVNDLMALTRALYSLTDRIAWLGILRAPWCGLELADLEALIGGDKQRTVWELITDPACGERLSPVGCVRLQSVVSQLAVALVARGRLPYTDLVARTWHALHGPVCVEPTAIRYANRYFELLADLESEGRELTAVVLTPEVARHFAPLSASSEAVQIMTIHHAKGLEFDYVLLPELQRPVRVEPRRLLLGQAPTGAGGGLVLAPLPHGKRAEPIYDYLRAREQRALNVETYRLLYVAMTRARVALHLFAVAPGERGPRRGTFLQLLWPALDAVTATAEDTIALAAHAPRIALRRLPLAAMPAAPPANEWSTAAASPPVEYTWASPLAKHVGTVTHALLQRYTQVQPPHAPTTLQREVRLRLRALGVASPELETAVHDVITTIDATLKSERGRWLLSPEHTDAHSEYRLTAISRQRSADVIVDRTFIDAHGVRWIVDYKTGIHLGGDRDAFMDSEVARYRSQLQTYATYFRAREMRVIRLALYFPRLDGWREWAADDTQ